MESKVFLLYEPSSVPQKIRESVASDMPACCDLAQADNLGSIFGPVELQDDVTSQSCGYMDTPAWSA